MMEHRHGQSSAAPTRRAPQSGVSLTRFARLLLREWKRLELAKANETVVLAVSGGADSVALLLVLDELIKSKKLKIRVFVAHLDHRLRGKTSAADARWVAALAKRLGH